MPKLNSDSLLQKLVKFLEEFNKDKDLKLTNVEQKIIANEVATSLIKTNMDATEFLDNPKNKESLHMAFLGVANQRRDGTNMKFDLDNHFKETMSSSMRPEPPTKQKHLKNKIEELLKLLELKYGVIKKKKEILIEDVMSQRNLEKDFNDLQEFTYIQIFNADRRGSPTAHATVGILNVYGFELKARPVGLQNVQTNEQDNTPDAVVKKSLETGFGDAVDTKEEVDQQIKGWPPRPKGPFDTGTGQGS